MNIENIPKVELHLHLDGSVNTNLASKLLGEEVKDKMSLDKEKTTLNEYLEKFSLPVSLMQTKENLELISKTLVEDLKKENVIYAEIRFAPLKHLEGGLSKEEVVDSVLKGLKEVDIKTGLILCMMRGESYETNKEVIYLAKEYLNKGVVAIDLAGAEGLFPTKDYEELFKLAKELGVPFTIHAGEADGPESIKSALSFGTKRLGHGVRAEEDEELLQKIINENITLEVCPTSNINTSIFDNYKEHNIKKLFDMGVRVTINTDNRTVSNVTLNEEYQKLKYNFNFTEEDFRKMNRYAIKAAFIDDDEKQKLLEMLGR